MIRIFPRSIASLALAGFVSASAFAFPGDDAVVASLRLRVTDKAGKAIDAATACFESADADGAAIPFVRRDDGAFELPPRPLIVDGFVTLGAPGFATERFAIAYGRSERGVIALGSLALEAGVEARLVVVQDGADTPIAGAAVYAIERGSRFPPRDPADWKGPSTLLDDSSRLGVTDAAGTFSCGLPRDFRALAIVPPGGAPVFVEPAIDGEMRVRTGSTAALRLRITTTEARRIASGRVRAFVDLGGAGYETELALDVENVLPLDVERSVRIAIDAKGFRSVSRVFDSPHGEAVTIDLEPLELKYARITAADAVTKKLLPIRSLRLGRARAEPRESPGRIDFAPDWNSFRIDGAAIADGATELVCATPESSIDLLLAADDHIEKLVRGLRFEGTFEEPTPLALTLAGSLPIQGRVFDKATGRPIAGATVTLRRSSRDLDDLPIGWKLRGTVGFVLATTTRANGAFLVASEAFENLLVEVEAPDHGFVTIGPVARSAAHDLRVELAKTVTIDGRIEVPGAAAFAWLLEPVGLRVVGSPVDEKGAFHFEGVAPADYRLFAGPDLRPLLARLDTDASARLAKWFRDDPGLAVSVANDLHDVIAPLLWAR